MTTGDRYSVVKTVSAVLFLFSASMLFAGCDKFIGPDERYPVGTYRVIGFNVDQAIDVRAAIDGTTRTWKSVPTPWTAQATMDDEWMYVEASPPFGYGFKACIEVRLEYDDESTSDESCDPHVPARVERYR